MNKTRKTAPTVSEAVKSFMKENNLTLDLISANLVYEKIFMDKKEYTLELSQKIKSNRPPHPASDKDSELALEIIKKLLELMKFTDFEVKQTRENNSVILTISTRSKDGLLIGKNGQNLLAMQYLISIIIDKKLQRHVPVIIDVGSYRHKRISYLKSLSASLAERALSEKSEVITNFLPAYERKIIHEEIAEQKILKTFSIGRGPYKKVVITSILEP